MEKLIIAFNGTGKETPMTSCTKPKQRKGSYCYWRRDGMESEINLQSNKNGNEALLISLY